MSHDTGLCYSDLVAVTPSDTTEQHLHGFYVGGAGNVTVRTEKGTVVTFTAVPVGVSIHNISIDRVMAATTATLIIGYKP